MNATYAKLRDGSWGVRVQGVVKADDIVTVTKRSGEAVAVSIGRVVWSGSGVTLCEIARPASRRAAAPKRAYAPKRAAAPDVRIEFPSQGATYCHDRHGVYVYDEFPSSSVLAGQQRRAFKTSGTLEECQAYCREHFGSAPDHVSGCGYVAPYVAHLPTGQDW